MDESNGITVIPLIKKLAKLNHYPREGRDENIGLMVSPLIKELSNGIYELFSQTIDIVEQGESNDITVISLIKKLKLTCFQVQ